MKLAKRSNISPSLTMAMNTKAKQMRAQGQDVISFAAGEPDFHTPDHIKKAGKSAIDDNKTYYTPASGIVELKEQVLQKFDKENNLHYKIDQVSINSGAKHSVFNVLFVLVAEGDEVILPAPYWVSYSEMVRICSATPVFVDTTEESGFKLTPEQLGKSISPNTKAILLNSPCNPTGAVYTREELTALAEILEEQNIIIISDEIYEKIVYDNNKHFSIAQYSEKLKSKTVVINGMSKAYSMTGWRIGYAAGPKEIIGAVNKLQGHTAGNPTSISQWASVEGLDRGTSFVTDWVEEFSRRRDYIVSELNSIDGISCTTPGGAFYVFPNIKAILGRSFGGKKIEGSVDFAYYLLEKGHIAVVPGQAFGAEGYMRISFATSMDNIVEGMKRLKAALA